MQPKNSLSKIQIYNFKGIKKIELGELPKQANWIFLTGENGIGKTTILQAISSALAGIEEHLFEYFSTHDQTELTCHLHGTYLAYTISGNSNLRRMVSESNPNYPYLACYGSSRLDTYSESSRVYTAITQNLYETRHLLENIELQLSRWYFKKKDKEFGEKYEKVSKILVDLLHIDRIEIDAKTDQVLYYEKDTRGEVYPPLPSSQLASGLKSIICMIGDMILKLFRTQPDIVDPQHLKGIVIIDELDLHFHPKWQKRIPTLLTSIFPNIQFIASTHSPIPLLGAPKGSVFLKVHRNAEEGVTLERLIEMEEMIDVLLPNAILTSPIFGLQDIFPVTHEKATRIRTEDSFDEVLFNNFLDERLKKFKGSNLEEDFKQYLSSKKARDDQ